MPISVDLLRKELLEKYNQILNLKTPNPIEQLDEVIVRMVGYDIPEISLCHALKSDLLYEKNKFEEAYHEVEQANRMDPDRLEVLHSLVNVYLPRKDVNNPYADGEKVLEVVHKIEQVYDEDAKALNLAAKIYNELGLYDDTLRLLFKAYQVTPKTDEIGREALQHQITKTYLQRYQSCPNDENLVIMKYLVELIDFKYNTLTDSQYATAVEELAERCSYVLEEACETKAFAAAANTVEMIRNKLPLTLDLVNKLTSYFQISNQHEQGIEFFSQATKVHINEHPSILSCLLQHRALLYRNIGKEQNAMNDLNDAKELSKSMMNSSQIFRTGRKYDSNYHRFNQNNDSFTQDENNSWSSNLNKSSLSDSDVYSHESRVMIRKKSVSPTDEINKPKNSLFGVLSAKRQDALERDEDGNENQVRILTEDNEFKDKERDDTDMRNVNEYQRAFIEELKQQISDVKIAYENKKTECSKLTQELSELRKTTNKDEMMSTHETKGELTKEEEIEEVKQQRDTYIHKWMEISHDCDTLQQQISFRDEAILDLKLDNQEKTDKIKRFEEKVKELENIKSQRKSSHDESQNMPNNGGRINRIVRKLIEFMILISIAFVIFRMIEMINRDKLVSFSFHDYFN